MLCRNPVDGDQDAPITSKYSMYLGSWVPVCNKVHQPSLILALKRITKVHSFRLLGNLAKIAEPVQFPREIGRMTVQKIIEYKKGMEVQPEILIPTKLYYKADADKDPELEGK